MRTIIGLLLVLSITGMASAAVLTVDCQGSGDFTNVQEAVDAAAVGKAKAELLQAVESAARAAGCTSLWAITTNDNLDALRFFQRRGFEVKNFRIGGMAKIRLLKPSIPQTGCYGIAVRDEIELEKPIEPGRGWRVV